MERQFSPRPSVLRTSAFVALAGSCSAAVRRSRRLITRGWVHGWHCVLLIGVLAPGQLCRARFDEQARGGLESAMTLLGVPLIGMLAC